MSLTLVTGPMFSGKSEHSVLECVRQSWCGRSVTYITHAIDDRKLKRVSSSHSGISASELISSINFKEIRLTDSGLLEFSEGDLPDVVVIDEGQFFTTLYPAVMNMFGKTLLTVSGLNFDYLLNPMGDLHRLPATTHIHKTSFCMHEGCNADAHFTRRRTVEKSSKTSLESPSGSSLLISFPEYLSKQDASEDVPPEDTPEDAPDSVIRVGGADFYEAVCARHHPRLSQ